MDALQLRLPLMHELNARGFQMAAAGANPQPEFETEPFDYFQYPLGRSLNPLAERRAKRRLIELFQEHQPELVHAVNTKPCLLVPPAAARAGIPSVRTITGLGAVYSASDPMSLALRVVYRHLQKKMSRLSSATAFQNPDDYTFFVKSRLVAPERASVVMSSGIDVDGYRKSCSDAQTLNSLRAKLKLENRTVVTLVSRLFRPKGINELLAAAEQLRNEFPQVVFLLAGPLVTTGPGAVSSTALNAAGDNVRHLGPRSDVPDLLALSDLFVLPSYLREGVPRVLLEAGAMGLPLITTDMPGCRETVQHGWNGLIIPPRNTAALTDALRQLLASAWDRQAMGQRSIEFIRERFSLSHVADAYAALYRKALGLAADSRELKAA